MLSSLVPFWRSGTDKSFESHVAKICGCLKEVLFYSSG